MPLALPNLDDLTWEELVAEGRSQIPTWAPEWTNHNAADPGITLIELFAYLSEMLIYRLNRVSDEHLRLFLKLINGPDWKPAENLHADKRETVQSVRRPHRAVSCRDFEILTLAANEKLEAAAQTVGRAKCILRSNLSGDRTAAESFDTPGHVSVLVVPDSRTQPSAELLKKVREALELARLLTTCVHVVPPRYVALRVRVTVAVEPHAVAQTVRAAAVEHLRRFFDPLEGGPDGTGWPFGRSVYTSEIYQRLSTLPDVNYVTRSVDPSIEGPTDEILVSSSESWRLKRNRLGQLEAIELRPDELVAAWIDEEDITVVSQGSRL